MRGAGDGPKHKSVDQHFAQKRSGFADILMRHGGPVRDVFRERGFRCGCVDVRRLGGNFLCSSLRTASRRASRSRIAVTIVSS